MRSLFALSFGASHFSLSSLKPCRHLLLPAALLLLTSCASIANKPLINDALNSSTWLKHKNALSDIESWQIKGRFSAKTSTETWTGSIIWLQQARQYKINISGPLSTGSILLEGTDGFAQLQLSENQFASDTNPQSLLYDQTGLNLPVNELKHWLLGLPHPQGKKDTEGAITLNQNSLLSKLEQNNWEVTFKRYTTVNDVQLPNKIFLKNQDIDVRLIIQQWQINT